MYFQYWYFQLKKGTPVLPKSFVFQESLSFKFKALKMFKISSDCHIKIGQTAKQRVILKIPVPFFRETYGLFVGIKIKHQRCDSPIKNSVLNVNLGARDILLRRLLLQRLQYCNFFYLFYFY